ncbi:MAG: ParB/RepB/Spo0J family partition protein [Pseudomonadota bacterium]
MTEPTPIKKRKKMVLGKGLDALIPNLRLDAPTDTAPKPYFFCKLDVIQPNRYQPRSRFMPEELAELAESIRSQGIIQPLLVRQAESGYELVAGERRLRAARMAGLETVPVVVRDLSDAEVLEMSIVENIQREDFNPVEESDAYHRLMTEFGLTQDQVATRVGKSRSAVANFLRLRHLPQPIREGLADGTLSAGHARALLGLDQQPRQLAAYREVIQRQLTVRQTEQLVNRLKKAASTPTPRSPGSETVHYSRIAEDLSRHYGTKVQISRRQKQGKVEIQFYNDDDLDRLLALLVPR